MNSDVHINVLAGEFHDWFKWESSLNEDLVLQEDNAKPHKSEYSKWWKETHEIETTDHPPRSPDTNPFEHVWGIIKRRLRAYHSLRTVADLKAAIQREWDALDDNHIRRSAHSIPDRVRALREARGWNTWLLSQFVCHNLIINFQQSPCNCKEIPYFCQWGMYFFCVIILRICRCWIDVRGHS